MQQGYPEELQLLASARADALSTLMEAQAKAQSYASMKVKALESLAAFMSDNRHDLPAFVQEYLKAWQVEQRDIDRLTVAAETVLDHAHAAVQSSYEAFEAGRTTYVAAIESRRNLNNPNNYEDIAGTKFAKLLEQMRLTKNLARTEALKRKGR